MRSTKHYQALPFNPKLKERARALRKAGNLAEVLLWGQLKGNQLRGLDFDRQKIIGNYIVDFYCAQQQLVIEVDGSSHDDKEEYDALRDAYLTGLGLFVIHVSDREVKHNLPNLLEMLSNHIALTNSPPLEGWQAKPDGVVITQRNEITGVCHS